MKMVIAGAGGHAKVVCDAILASGTPETDIVGFADDNPELAGRMVLGFPVLPGIDSLGLVGSASLAMGVGDNAARRRLFDRARALGYTLVTVVHPEAVIGRGCRIGSGTVVLANVVVNTDTEIGDNVILNTACSVDHDCVVGAHSHVAPGATLAGGVRIGEETLLGIGCTVIPGLSIGARCVIGAGAVLLTNLDAGCVAVGVPARVIKQRQGGIRG
jgi:sugar O-acyltransferase (sialic acid O-acetyltransferase NeuD family)